MSSKVSTGKLARISYTVIPVASTAECCGAIVLGQPFRAFFLGGDPQSRHNHDAGESPIIAADFDKDGTHPSGDHRHIGAQLPFCGCIESSVKVLDELGSDVIFANISQGLCDQSARSSCQSKTAARVAAKDDLALAQHDFGRSAVGLINKMCGYLRRQPQLIGGHLRGRQQPQMSPRASAYTTASAVASACPSEVCA
jgi:hypothetical protein